MLESFVYYFLLPLVSGFLLVLFVRAIRRSVLLGSLADFVDKVDFSQDEFLSKVDERFSKEAPEVLSSWQTFRHSLIVKGRYLRRSSEAAEHFHSGDLVDPVLFLDFSKHLPGILTGVGIICTFTGMKSGLGSASTSLKQSQAAQSVGATPIVASNAAADTAQERVLTTMTQELLEKIEPAIALSLVAVIFAIGFLFAERILYSFCVASLHKLQRALDRKFQRISDGALLQRVADSSDSIRDHSEQSMNTLKGINTDFVVAMTDSLRNLLTPIMSNQTEALNQSHLSLTGSVDRMGKSLQEAVTKIHADASDASGKTLSNLVEQFQNSLVEGAASQIKDMLKSIDGVQSILEGQKKAQENFIGSISLASTKLKDEVLDQVQNFPKLVSEEVRHHQVQLEKTTSEILHKIGEDVGQQLVRSQDHQVRVLKEMREHFDGSLVRISSQIDESAVSQANALQGLLYSVEKLAHSTNQSTTEAFEKGQSAMASSIDAISKSLMATTKTHNEELLQTMRDFRSGFEGSLERLSSQVESSQKSSQETSESLTAAAQSLASHVESSTKAMAAQIQSGTSNSLTAVTQNLQDLTKQQFGDVQASFTRTLESLASGTQALLAESRQESDKINAKIAILVSRLDSFGSSTQINNEKFAATVNQASQDIERLLGSVESPISRMKGLSESFLRQTEQLELLGLQLGTASQTLTSSVSEMSDGLAEAKAARAQTDRALSLAASLAKSVEEYQRGVSQVTEETKAQVAELRRFVEEFHVHSASAFAQMKTDAEGYQVAFHDGARRFLHEVDANLSKGTGSLSGAIEELADVLDDLRDLTRAASPKR